MIARKRIQLSAILLCASLIVSAQAVNAGLFGDFAKKLGATVNKEMGNLTHGAVGQNAQNQSSTSEPNTGTSQGAGFASHAASVPGIDPKGASDAKSTTYEQLLPFVVKHKNVNVDSLAVYYALSHIHKNNSECRLQATPLFGGIGNEFQEKEALQRARSQFGPILAKSKSLSGVINLRVFSSDVLPKYDFKRKGFLFTFSSTGHGYLPRMSPCLRQYFQSVQSDATISVFTKEKHPLKLFLAMSENKAQALLDKKRFDRSVSVTADLAVSSESAPDSMAGALSLSARLTSLTVRDKRGGTVITAFNEADLDRARQEAADAAHKIAESNSLEGQVRAAAQKRKGASLNLLKTKLQGVSIGMRLKDIKEVLAKKGFAASDVGGFQQFQKTTNSSVITVTVALAHDSKLPGDGRAYYINFRQNFQTGVTVNINHLEKQIRGRFGAPAAYGENSKSTKEFYYWNAQKTSGDEFIKAAKTCNKETRANFLGIVQIFRAGGDDQGGGYPSKLLFNNCAGTLQQKKQIAGYLSNPYMDVIIDSTFVRIMLQWKYLESVEQLDKLQATAPKNTGKRDASVSF